MISVSIYKFIHMLGIISVFMSLGGLTMHMINNGVKDHNWRKQLGITHGVGLALILLGGFGMLARKNIAFTEGWVLTKVLIWFVIAGLFAMVLRKPSISRAMWSLFILLGVLAAYMAIFKPF